SGPLRRSVLDTREGYGPNASACRGERSAATFCSGYARGLRPERISVSRRAVRCDVLFWIRARAAARTHQRVAAGGPLRRSVLDTGDSGGAKAPASGGVRPRETNSGGV